MSNNARHITRRRSSGPQITGISHKAAKGVKPDVWTRVKDIPGVTRVGIEGEGNNHRIAVYFESKAELAAASVLLTPERGVPLHGVVSEKFEEALVA